MIIHRDDVFVGSFRPPLGFSVTPIPLGAARVKNSAICLIEEDVYFYTIQRHEINTILKQNYIMNANLYNQPMSNHLASSPHFYVI